MPVEGDSGPTGPRRPDGEWVGRDYGLGASSGYDWKWSYSYWRSLADLPGGVREAEALSDLGEKYSKIRIKFKAPRGTHGAAVIRVEALNVRTGKWELVDLPPEHQQRLAGLGIRVVAEEAESAISSWLRPPTQLDKLAELAKVLLAPETLMPKILGLLAEAVARHAGMPEFVAKWVGTAVEQAASPLFEPEGARGALLAALEDFTVISDLESGQVTSAVVDLALNRLSDELTKKVRQ